MRERNVFNFENEIERLQRRIKLSPEALKDQFPLKQREECPCDAKKEVYVIDKEEEHRIKKQSTLAAMFQTKECLLFAFCLASPIESKLTIEVIKKTTAKATTTVLKKLEVEISCLAFVLDEEDEINLLAATKCGRLFVYKAFEEKQLQVQAIRLSSNEITYMLEPSYKNWVFVLNKAGTIYLTNFLQRRVYYEFRCSLPLIEDPKPRLIIDLSETYIGHAFSYGRLILWDISSQIKSILHRSTCEETKPSNDLDYSHWKKTNNGKKFVLRSKASIANSFIRGITWCDFLGTFICVIDHGGEMRIIAVSINDYNECQQFFTIISRYQVCKEKTIGSMCIFYSENHEKESVVDAIRLRQNNGIIVGKNVQVTNCGKKVSSQCFVEKYVLDSNFNVNKIVAVTFNQINLMEQFFLNSGAEYLLIRNSRQYILALNRNRKLG